MKWPIEMRTAGVGALPDASAVMIDFGGVDGRRVTVLVPPGAALTLALLMRREAEDALARRRVAPDRAAGGAHSAGTGDLRW